MTEPKEKPDTPSSDYVAMSDYLKMVATIIGGAKAMRAAGQTYLPKFPNEGQKNYELRIQNAKFTNIFRDIVENLAQRPFSKEVAIGDDAPQEIKDFIEDVDGQGNHLHVFAGETFFSAICDALSWILVDYTAGVPEGATRADEKRLGARPYWVRLPASAVIAAYSDVVDGQEQFIHVRIAETDQVRDGWGERTVERIRVFDRERLDGGYAPATWQVYEKQEINGEKVWVALADPAPVTIGVIPLVPVITGRRLGLSWQIDPPMRDAAYLQIEHYQQESALKNIKTLTAFPMLAGNGVNPPRNPVTGNVEPIPVGPQAVLFAPAGGDNSGGSWQFIEPGAESMRFLADDIAATAKELRELGRQPLTAQSGNLTVITTAFAAQKGNSAVQAWALGLKDALENAFALTARWLGIDYEAEVKIDTDFDLGIGGEDTFPHVLSMREQQEISREQVIREAKRRGIIEADYDGDDDLKTLLAEGEDETEDDLAAMPKSA